MVARITLPSNKAVIAENHESLSIDPGRILGIGLALNAHTGRTEICILLELRLSVMCSILYVVTRVLGFFSLKECLYQFSRATTVHHSISLSLNSRESTNYATSSNQLKLWFSRRVGGHWCLPASSFLCVNKFDTFPNSLFTLDYIFHVVL